MWEDWDYNLTKEYFYTNYGYSEEDGVEGILDFSNSYSPLFQSWTSHDYKLWFFVDKPIKEQISKLKWKYGRRGGYFHIHTHKDFGIWLCLGPR